MLSENGIIFVLKVVLMLRFATTYHFIWGLVFAGNRKVFCMSNRRFLPVFVALLLFSSSFASAARRPGWTSKKVDLRAGDGRRIKAIHYPKGKEVHTRRQKKTRVRKKMHKKQRPAIADPQTTNSVSVQPSKVTTGNVFVNTIESPPINGFIPWIAVTVTDESNGEEDYNAIPESSVTGNYFPANEHTDFAVGLFDTGASAHVMGYQASQILDLGWDMETGNYVEIAGVTGSVDTWVSKPLGVFIAGLNAIDTSVTPMWLDTSKLVGQSNVSIAVGEYPQEGAPDLPTAIGSPMSIFYTAVFDNDQPVSVYYEGKNYTAPNIELYPSGLENPAIPTYSIDIPLELRPGGAAAVSYIPTIDFGSLEMLPSSPSVIIGNSSQSLFFVHAVDLYDDDEMAFDKSRFMIDTGAQVTVIGKRIAARLGIDVNDPEFIVDIEGVSGEVSEIGGYYIDEIEIPALGEWVTFTNVPVILLDIASPEGGTLDGIIGMNLFNEYNMVLRGGGMFLQDDPSLELELITTPPATLAGDIAPDPVDGVVDAMDMQVFMQAWLTSSGDSNFNYLCDIAPESISDGKVDLQDMALMATNWLREIN